MKSGNNAKMESASKKMSISVIIAARVMNFVPMEYAKTNVLLSGVQIALKDNVELLQSPNVQEIINAASEIIVMQESAFLNVL